MKTSKIKTVHSAKEYAGKNGVTIYHNLTMENGDEINIGKKKTCVVGDELTYELTGDDDGQQRFKKAKSVQPENNFKAGYKSEPKDQGIITYLSCLSSACVRFQQSTASDETILAFALKGFNEAMKHSTLKKD